MRGRINLMDLWDKPFNHVHELLYYTFCIKEEREKQKKEEEKAKAAEEEKKKKLEEMNKDKVRFSNKRFSPAAQAKAIRDKKFQDDEKAKREGQEQHTSTNSMPSSTNIDMEELTDILEEGI